MRSALYTAETTEVAGIVNGSTLPLGSIVRRVGCNVDLSGNSILIKGTGYYAVVASFTMTPSADDTVTIQALQNGVPIPGAKAAFNGSTEKTVPIVFMVRQCCCDTGAISFVVTTDIATTTVTEANAGVDIVKL